MSKEERIRDLVYEFKKWDNFDNGSKDMICCIARDNKRKIKKIFEKEMHESILNYLNNN